MFALTRPVPETQEQLAADLVGALGQLPVEQRVRLARWLADAATARAMSAAADAAVVEMTATMTYAEAAQRLGVSSATVNKAVTSHRRRAKEQVEA